MEWQSVIITETKWHKFSKELRKEVLDVIPKSQIIGRYADEVINAIKMYNKYELAEKMEKELRFVILHEANTGENH